MACLAATCAAIRGRSDDAPAEAVSLATGRGERSVRTSRRDEGRVRADGWAEGHGQELPRLERIILLENRVDTHTKAGAIAATIRLTSRGYDHVPAPVKAKAEPLPRIRLTPSCRCW